jgi:hypothetical protein
MSILNNTFVYLVVLLRTKIVTFRFICVHRNYEIIIEIGPTTNDETKIIIKYQSKVNHY